MKFWAIAYKYQEDVYVDFEKREDTLDLTESCFLPTREMAEEYIEDELGDWYVPVEITLGRLESSGVWTYNRGEVVAWENI